MIFLGLTAMIAACSDATGVAGRDMSGQISETDMTSPPRSSAPNRDLPFAGGQQFATLDEYLAFLKKAGEYDTPWYREIKPGVGVYERITRLPPGQRPRTFTRAELMKKYGFSS